MHRFLVFTGVLIVCYAGSFFDLIRVAFQRDLFSHLPLIPCIVVYLLWQLRGSFASLPVGVRWPGIPLAFAGLLLPILIQTGAAPSLAAVGNRLPAMLFSFCLLLYAGGFLILGSRIVRVAVFPALFLLFMLPFPPAVENGIEWFLQHTSAEVAYLFIQGSGIPVLRRDLTFDMPGLSVAVAPECSGIRSSWVLLITSLLAGHLFLKPRWKRALLALIVIPLGILRNGFRILVISFLCVHHDPAWIDSPLHHRGGPIFFALSLIPFTFILLWLLKSEKRPAAPSSQPHPPSPSA